MSETAETAPRILVSVQPVAVDRATAASMLAMSVDSLSATSSRTFGSCDRGSCGPCRWPSSSGGLRRTQATFD